MTNIIKNIDDFNFKNKTALLRVDFNVPIDNFKNITDDTRIKYTIPTIKKIIYDGGKIVIISHFGRPKGIQSKKYSLKFLKLFLSKQLNNIPVFFYKNCIGENIEKKINEIKYREILILENLRFHKEEEECNKEFALKLSKYGDIYVNDAFGVCHRYHSSIYILPKFFKKKCIGYLLKKEIENIDKFLSKKVYKPITIILGGSKISTKLDLIDKLWNLSDYILIGGGIAYPFISELGGKIGNSLIDNKINNSTIINIIKKNKKKQKIYFPTDVIISKFFTNSTNNKVSSIFSIPKKYMGLDIGPNTINIFCDIIKKSKTILWNGPMGVFEFSNFSKGTRLIAKEIKKITKKGAFSMIGGGDSISALKQEKCINDISYISTGGGAMLEYLKNKKLPGIISMMI